MPVAVGPKPEVCPECGNRDPDNFILLGVRLLHDLRRGTGADEVRPDARARITTWECGTCNLHLEIWNDFE